MNRNLYVILSVFFCLNSTILSQNPEWIVYDQANSGLPSNSITCIATEEIGNKWIGTEGGLVKYDGINWTVYDTSNSGLQDNGVNSIALDRKGNKWIGTGNFFTVLTINGSGLTKFDGTNWTFYNTSNSGLPINEVYPIAIDGSGNKWIGTSYGLAKFDDTSWTVYNSSNSGLPGGYVGSLALDGSGNKWIGTSNGLARLDDTNWTVYNTSNSSLPSNGVPSIALDESGNKWIGTWVGGLAKFDDINWTVYNTSNSNLPDNSVPSITIDESGNKWIGTWGGGLAKFDGTNWTVFNTSNSGLPDNYVSSIAIDGGGNKWIGTDGGLAVYKEGGVVSVEEKIDASNTIPTNYVLHQNYPNPFNPSTTIKYQLPSNLANRQAGVKSETMPTGRQAANVKLMVFDILGREVVTLVNEKQNPGYYEVEWNAKAIPSGVYFYKLKTGSYVETKKMLMMK